MDSNEIQENCDNSPRHCDIGAEETYQKTFVFLNVIENSVAVSTYNDVVQSFRRLRSQKSKKKYNWPLIIAIVVFLIGLATIIVYALRYGAFSNQPTAARGRASGTLLVKVPKTITIENITFDYEGAKTKTNGPLPEIKKQAIFLSNTVGKQTKFCNSSGGCQLFNCSKSANFIIISSINSLEPYVYLKDSTVIMVSKKANYYFNIKANIHHPVEEPTGMLVFTNKELVYLCLFAYGRPLESTKDECSYSFKPKRYESVETIGFKVILGHFEAQFKLALQEGDEVSFEFKGYCLGDLSIQLETDLTQS